MIDLKPFCGDDFSRYYLQAPWSEGAHTYATDGIIFVRVARRDDVPETDATRFVNAAYLFQRSEGSGFVPLPHFDLPDDDDCHACGGSGYAHACDDCGHECEECGGDGSTASQTSVGIFGASYNARYIALLRELPDISIETGVKTGSEPLHFRFDGGDGMLMPLHSPYEVHIEVECAQ